MEHIGTIELLFAFERVKLLLLLRFFVHIQLAFSIKGRKDREWSFLRHFKSNNMSKVKIVRCVEDNRKAPTRHFHISHNASYLPPKILHKPCFQFLLGQL